MIQINLLAGWLGMLAGIMSGAITGLFFHRGDWLGGYSSYRRRLTRLGHISFWGLAFLNLFFALTATSMRVEGIPLTIASASLLAGAVTMPACCYLTAWRKSLRHLFPIPVAATLSGVLALLVGWRLR